MFPDFPNDVCIGELIDAAKSFRQLFPDTAMLETRSLLEWFIRCVQDRIVLCTLRRLLVNFANKSRSLIYILEYSTFSNAITCYLCGHSFECLDRVEIIVAHMVGGVDASLKTSQVWPVSNHALKLISLKRSSQYSKEILLSFLCKVEEEANSLDAHIRQNILSFVAAIEEMLMQRMNTELQSDINSEN